MRHRTQGRLDMRTPANRFFVLACEGELEGLPDVPRRWCAQAGLRPGYMCLLARCRGLVCHVVHAWAST